MGDESNLFADDPKLAPILSGTKLPTSEGWKAVQAKQRKDVGRSTDMSSTGNQTRAAHMLAERFTYYATAVKMEPRHTLNGGIFIIKEKNGKKQFSDEAKSRMN